MTNWMKKLARHYEQVRKEHPEDELLLLFDIDGTILDMRWMILHLLKSFDATHGTEFFQKLSASEVDIHENQIDQLLERLNVPRLHRAKVQDWYLTKRWSSDAILQAHHPFRGVMEVIRWFQIQPRTSVGLNTGRPEEIREDTLRSLNELGKEYRVRFSDDLLYMNPGAWEENVEHSKVAGVRHFQQAGYRVVCMIDNEPENLHVIADADTGGEILLLHADTIFETTRTALPAGAAGGAKYDITELITEKALPRHIQFVWHGLNDEANIRQFLASNIRWAEFDVRTDGDGYLMLRHDSLAETPLQDDEELLPMEEVLTRLQKFNKAVKLDLKEGGEVIDRVIDTVRSRGCSPEDLWFNGNVDVLGEDAIRKLAEALPGSIVQCPIDFLSPLIATLPEHSKTLLDMLRDWGVNRFSVNWDSPQCTELIDLMDTWGLEVNIYNVPDLESFLRAVLLQPRSITSDFNFPQWHYYGRGSGQDAHRFEYELRPEASNDT